MEWILLFLLVSISSSSRTTTPLTASTDGVVDARELEESGWDADGKQTVEAEVRRLVEDFQSSVEALKQQEVTCKVTRQTQCRECVHQQCQQRLEDLNCASLANRVRGALETVCRTAADIPGFRGRIGGGHEYCTRLSGVVVSTLGNVVHSIADIDWEFAEKIRQYLLYGSVETAERMSDTLDALLANVGVLLNRTGHDVDMDRVRTTVRDGMTKFGDNANDFFQELPIVWNDIKTRTSLAINDVSEAFSRWTGNMLDRIRSRRSSPWVQEIEPTCSAIRWQPVRACMKYMAYCDTCTPVQDTSVCPGLRETEERVEKLEMQISCLRAVAQQDWSYNVDGVRLETDRDTGVAVVSLFGRQGAVVLGEGEGGGQVASNALAEYLDECTNSVEAYVRRLRHQ